MISTEEFVLMCPIRSDIHFDDMFLRDPSGNSGSNRPDGSRRNMSSKCMSERMGHIRTNSSVEIIRKPYLSAANERRCIWRGASGLTFTNKVHGKCTLTCHNDNCENIIEVC